MSFNNGEYVMAICRISELNMSLLYQAIARRLGNYTFFCVFFVLFFSIGEFMPKTDRRRF